MLRIVNPLQLGLYSGPASTWTGGRMFFSRLTSCLLAVPLGILSLHSTLSAQTSRGAVTGLVTDPQKAGVPNAQVELIGLATNVSRSTRTNESGLYRFDAVDPGGYKLTVEAVGFH